MTGKSIKKQLEEAKAQSGVSQEQFSALMTGLNELVDTLKAGSPGVPPAEQNKTTTDSEVATSHPKGFIENLSSGVKGYRSVCRAQFNARYGIEGDKVSGLLKIAYVFDRIGKITSFDTDKLFSFEGVQDLFKSLYMVSNPSFRETVLAKTRQFAGMQNVTQRS